MLASCDKPEYSDRARMTNLTDGGAPAGINILAGPELGCLTNNVKIRTTTMQGKRMTTPRGTEMLEFPFSLRGRLKYARREAIVPRCLFSSAVGRWGVWPTGRYFPARRRRSMMMDSGAESRMAGSGF